MGVGSERYFSIRFGPRCGRDCNLLCWNVRLLDSAAEVASKRERLPNPFRSCAQYRRSRSLFGADDRTDAARASSDVRHGVDRVCKLAVGAEVPPGTSGEAKIGRGLTICAVNWKLRPRDRNLRAAEASLELLDAAGAVGKWALPIEDVTSVGHLMGTCRMGNDPKSSVVDKYHRADDVQTCSLWMAAAS